MYSTDIQLGNTTVSVRQDTTLSHSFPMYQFTLRKVLQMHLLKAFQCTLKNILKIQRRNEKMWCRIYTNCRIAQLKKVC